MDQREIVEEIEEYVRLDVLVNVSAVRQLYELAEFIDDTALDIALEYMIKLISKPDVPIAKIPTLIVELQAIGAKMQMMAAYYQNVSKNTAKKNTYYSMYHAIDRLVDAIKYLVRGKF